MYRSGVILFLIFITAGQAGLGQGHWESVILAGQQWKYLPAVSEPPADWMMPGFDDSSWPVGPGGIGYADGDDATVIGPVNSLYLRRSFELPVDTLIRRLLLDIDYDDAFVAYLNGVEFARSPNVTGTKPAYNGALTTDREAVMYSGGVPERYEADTSLLQPGTNVLAVHILNFDINSSDLSAIVFLQGAITTDGSFYSPTPDWFTAPADEVATRLPVIRINTFGQNIINDPRIAAHMGIIYNGPGQLNNADDPFNEYDGRITIETRGQSSLEFPKKSYRLETQDSAGMNLNIPLLGMPAENDWILYAPYSDKSMLRNAVTFELARHLDPYCSRMAFVELYLNDDYRGVYILMEKIKRDDNRVNIARLEPHENAGDELTGGYIFKVDKVDPGDVEGVDWFRSSPNPSYPNAKDIIYQYYDPGNDELTVTQRNYLKQSIIEAEAVLISDSFDDPETGYNRYLNTGSFVDFMLMSEISKEVDKYRYSNYFYKKKESKGGEIFAGPIWDFNLGYGNVDYWQEGLITSGWLYDDLIPEEWSMMFWWARLNDDPWFHDLATTRWKDMRENAFSNTNIQALIDSLAGYIDAAQQRNFDRWPILGNYVWPNYNWQGNTYEDEVTYFSNWLFTRLAWLDNNFNGNVLEPSVSISGPGWVGDNLHLRLELTDDYFNNRSLRKKYFNLATTIPLLFVDTVYYESPTTATLSLWASPSISIDGSAISVQIDDRILNGFKPLVTETIVLDAAVPVFDDPFKAEIYAAGKTIIVRTNDVHLLPDHMKVYSMTGRLVEIHTLERSVFNEIPTSLQPGIYVVSLETPEAPVYQKVLIR
jgi:hypothetical protein